MMIRRMRFACWISKATSTHLEYVIIIDFPLQQLLCKRASILRLYVHCLSYIPSYPTNYSNHKIRLSLKDVCIK